MDGVCVRERNLYCVGLHVWLRCVSRENIAVLGPGVQPFGCGRWGFTKRKSLKTRMQGCKARELEGTGGGLLAKDGLMPLMDQAMTAWGGRLANVAHGCPQTNRPVPRPVPPCSLAGPLLHAC